jgi:hypothetical protein
MQKLKWLYVRLLPQRLVMAQTVLLLVCVLAISSQAFAVIRFTDRSLLVYSNEPGATTTYKVSFTYTTAATVGSVDMLFCNDPIPTDPCDAPAGLNVSGAVLADQAGETGYHISTRAANHLVLSRAPGVVGNTPSTYTFTDVVNPTDSTKSFSIRLSDYASTDATGSLINLGSIVSQVATGIHLETQVPPILVFCVAQQVSQNCTDTSGGNYSDLGALSATNTLTATSQMAAGTNASGGFVITVNGPPMEAGTSVIDPLTTPKFSAPGNSQFGINLATNTTPAIGHDPDGDFANAVVAPNYAIPNKFMYQDGDIVASAPNVALVRRFTVSYIVNVPPDLRAGVYTTTLTYICTGRF